MIEVIGRSPANIRVEPEAAVGISIAKKTLLGVLRPRIAHCLTNSVTQRGSALTHK
jgi:hypothetical protein